MPIYQLSRHLAFPDPEEAEDGIIAVGGDLNPERLLLAYRSGIFPWYSENEPIIWWSPDPRFVLFPEEIKVSKSMKQLLKRKQFKVTFDTAFDDVIMACANKPREGQEGTWITDEMRDAYNILHRLGWAHSVEVWNKEGKLVGGLYGVSIGACFFGESMFHHESNASKYGFISLVGLLRKKGFSLIDSQVHTSHLESLGAKEIPRSIYLKLLATSLNAETHHGTWVAWASELDDLVL